MLITVEKHEMDNFDYINLSKILRNEKPFNRSGKTSGNR
jgi:hypothetical protein